MVKTLTPLRFVTAQEGAFHRALQRRAYGYLHARGDHRFANRRAISKAVLILLAAIVCYSLALRASQPLAFMAGYVAFAVLMMWLNIDVNHDASHHTFVRSRVLNAVISRVVTLSTGIEPVYWRVRHVSFHHRYANIERYDLDTEENGIFRQTPFQRWRGWMRWQHIYWPLVAALSLSWIGVVFDWADRLGRTPLRAERLLPGAAGWAAFIFSKLGHLTLMLGLPLLMGHNGGLVLGLYLLVQMCTSLMVVFLLLGTHWADAAFYQAPAGENPVMAHGWYYHNFMTACDWHTPQRWQEMLTGGLNYHLTHHLFPGWHHRHYPALARIIGELAAEHGLPYRCIRYGELRAAQRAFLRQMGCAHAA
ncbi:acyl-CoA desaturase [Cronobacter dublinensis]|uniref:acyl-CoA desaturase n=1 Tax=Cronobacter dublinensis TaxID=413497 RepID=UPI0023DD3EDD|nr:acyl-CoA desaturase [Cronobacter dublinensis]MDT3664675.1 acyl-CoA desaturase [Cronobacter dublinensis]WEP43737.1 acyl-CoA desaturase [Cronobacter dublinensis]